MIIIGISGKKRSGKDTIAEMIFKLSLSWCRNNNHIAIRVGFADALYREVAVAVLGDKLATILPVDTRERMIKETIELIKIYKDHFRLILQGWGSDFRRDFCDGDYWINKFTARVSKFPDNTLLVVPDVRFENEMHCLGEKAYMWRVIRPNDNLYDPHQSENSIPFNHPRFNATIMNNGTLEELEIKVKAELKHILI